MVAMLSVAPRRVVPMLAKMIGWCSPSAAILVERGVGEQLAGQEAAEHVAFGAAVGDVAPAVLEGDVEQFGEEAHHLALEIEGIEQVVAVLVPVAAVVDGKAHETVQQAVVEVGGFGVADIEVLVGEAVAPERLETCVVGR
ncbi:hypothetical protein WR25_24078 [Diploscapter pachys]|uniref:Uncharacterized protein n=1 Tax=Diploscapter pachys TaxID=2018661 RepID=A0A2A2KBP8_9BILA|nr:hypothetical protein WR25_24078 [Diploscapter pachys]